MQHPKDFYDSQIRKYNSHLNTASRKLGISSLLRLLVFLTIVFGIYYFFGNFKAIIPILIIGIGIFIFLVSRHSDLKYKRDKFLALIRINEIEKEVLNRNFHQLPTGKEF
ncbi:MAG TPA: DNA mismatch repair protein MutS, partial [Salinimicrobium sp.]|nr:DNA mismatch repair protein MutS [Salinimicrobium sp.]